MAEPQALDELVARMQEQHGSAWEQRTALFARVEWSADLCPTGLCDGEFYAPHPDEPEQRLLVPCDLRDTPDCPQHTTHERLRDEAWLQQCGVPRRYWHQDPGLIRKLEEIEAYVELFRSGEHEGTGLLLSGGVGVGKTRAMAYIVRKLRGLPPERIVRFLTSVALFNALHDQETNVAELARPELLLLDDFGVEHRTDWTLSRFGELVEARYSRMLPTVVSTNLTPGAMARGEGSDILRCVDRWVETMRPIIVPGQSQRSFGDGQTD